VAEQRHNIIGNRLALVGEESVSGVTSGIAAGLIRRTHPCPRRWREPDSNSWSHRKREAVPRPRRPSAVFGGTEDANLLKLDYVFTPASSRHRASPRRAERCRV